MNTSVIAEASIVPVKIWWQVYIDRQVFGFSTKDNVIVDHPERHYCGWTLQQYKPVLLNQRAKVYKICEQIIS